MNKTGRWLLIHIVIADDHPVVRQGLTAVLERADWHVVAEAGNGLEALALVKRHRPDVLIADIVMPQLNGLEVARRAHEDASLETRVLLLSMYDAEPYVLEAIRAGASGYVRKGAASDVIVDAVHAALAGRLYLSPPLDERPPEYYLRKAHQQAADPYESLTAREREVIQMVAEGLTNRDIGHRLAISHRTVEIHRANAMHKLGLERQTDVARYALQRGWIPSDSATLENSS